MNSEESKIDDLKHRRISDAMAKKYQKGCLNCGKFDMNMGDNNAVFISFVCESCGFSFVVAQDILLK